MLSAMISNIQRMSFHDGPGMRTTVFFKGCNLRCAWCHNPETQSLQPELTFDPARCVGCGRCAAVCPAGARRMTPEGPEWNRTRCTVCGACADACLTGAIGITGRLIPLQQLQTLVLRDEKIFRTTGGGVTCSGGEPLLQAQAVGTLLSAMRARGIHTCVDTAGNVPWDAFDQVLPVTDLFLYDVKAWSPQTHEAYTSVRNERIVENLKRLSTLADLWIRVPLIPGVNTDQITQIGQFLSKLPRVRKVEVLPYHTLGIEKSKRLGRPQRLFEVPDERIQDAAERTLLASGLPVSIHWK